MIKENINSMIMTAMKAGDKTKAEVYRAIKAKFIEFTTARNAKPLDEAAEIQILNKMVKEREDSAAQYNAGNRNDLANSELCEAAIIKDLLPAAASLGDIRDTIEKYIAENGQFTQKEMGLVIKYIKANLSNVDGAMASTEVKAYISK